MCYNNDGDYMKPIIGILGRVNAINEKDIIFMYDNYRKAVIKYGGIPIMLLYTKDISYNKTNSKDIGHLNNEQKDNIIRQLQLCNGVIIPGGDRLFDEDIFICDYCNKKDIPLLGICMGMQVMCNYKNNNKNIKIENHNSDSNYKHLVKIDKNSRLFDILKESEILVNSLHNYKVSNEGDYDAVGFNEDTIEAIEKKENLFNIGFQWHPEKNYDKDLNSEKIFNSFIEAAKSKSYE